MTTTTDVGTRANNKRVRRWLSSLTPRLLIGNSWVPALSGQTFPSIDPTTESVLGQIASGQVEDIDAAVAAARQAFETGPWSRMGPRGRGQLLAALAQLIEDNLEELSVLEVLDNGMTLDTARAFTGAAIDSARFFAGAAATIAGETLPSEPGLVYMIVREPMGVCGAIVPWNAPLIAAVDKIAAAVAAGNTIVLKPAEQTSLTALRLGELVLEAGFPPGVVNIVTGLGESAGAALVDHPDVNKIAFTGSTEVGRTILRASASTFKRVTLELGGKAPNIVFPDADLDQAVPMTLAGYSLLAGQVCSATTRTFVHTDAVDEFVERLATHTSSLKLGDPLDPSTTLGPLASRDQLDRVNNYLKVGNDEGAIARTGGSPLEGRGFFVEPTIFTGVENGMRIAREEIFGPVMAVIPFTDEDDAVFKANDTMFGLSAAVWTSDLSRAHTVARRIKAGTVWINNALTRDVTMPFGGYKQSGIGRENGPRWFQDYTEEKAIFLKV